MGLTLALSITYSNSDMPTHFLWTSSIGPCLHHVPLGTFHAEARDEAPGMWEIFPTQFVSRPMTNANDTSHESLCN